MTLVTCIISGGQTGVDRGALKGATAIGFPTAGTAPRGWLIEDGSDKKFMKSMNMRQCLLSGYPPRTKANVINSDGTLLIATNFESIGTALTIRLCKEHGRPFFGVFFESFAKVNNDFKSWLHRKEIKTLNVAGTRESKATGIENFTEEFIKINFEGWKSWH